MLQTLANMILITSVSFKGLSTLSYQENDPRNLGLGTWILLLISICTTFIHKREWIVCSTMNSSTYILGMRYIYAIYENKHVYIFKHNEIEIIALIVYELCIWSSYETSLQPVETSFSDSNQIAMRQHAWCTYNYP